METLVGDVIEEIGDRLVPATPVLTGFARANWRPSLNVPVDIPVSFLDPSGGATVARIATIAARWRLGDIAYIRNNIAYIGALNAGSSPQAPPDFVEKAARDGRQAAFSRFKLRRVA
jgi:hypothetical protein